MSDLSGRAPRLGERPWLAVGPCDVELATFNGRPSAGLVATDFGAIVFWQFVGHGTDMGLWLYLPVTDDEAEYIVDHPAELMMDGLRDQLAGRQGVLGLSSHGELHARGPYKVEATKDHSDFVRQMLEAVSVGLSSAKQMPSTQRPVEFAPGSDQATAAARVVVRDTLAACAS